MYAISLRFQIAAILFLLLIVIDYGRTRKLPLLSTKVFTLLLGVTFVNLAFDVATVYTITHMDAVPAWINRQCHQLFIGSLDTVIYLLFVYVAVLGRGARKTNVKRMLLLSLPYAASLVFVVFGDLSYYYDGVSGYSYGSMATTIYVSVTFYILMIYVHILTHRDSFAPKTRVAVMVGTAIWIVAAIVQFFLPSLLISGLALVLMVCYIYLSFENPRESVGASGFNRRAFHLMLTESFNDGKPFTVGNIVLDDLARINDEAGYTTVTALLRTISEELLDDFGVTTYHYRWNSLAVILPAMDADELEARFDPILHRFEHRWELQSGKVYLHAHADALECPRFADDPDAVYEMLDFAYTQSASREADLFIVDESCVKGRKRRMAVEKLLDEALANDGLEVVYQPIYSAEKRAFVSAEALVRIKDTQTIGFVPPDEFIPVAEQKGTIAELGAVVLEQVCRFIHENKLWELGVEYVEVNLSGMQISDAELTDQIDDIFKRYGLSPAVINFEITESAAVTSSEQLRHNMANLRGMGCSFSMDDFGTGYSNLSQMAATRYDLVKLDKSLIWPCFGEAPTQPAVILRSIVSMILELETKLVAEGVETREQADALMEMGVTYLQGYLYSKPLHAAELLRFLQEHQTESGKE